MAGPLPTIRSPLYDEMAAQEQEEDASTDDETIIEMAYRWADIEEGIHTWFRTQPDGTKEEIGLEVGRYFSVLNCASE